MSVENRNVRTVGDVVNSATHHANLILHVGRETTYKLANPFYALFRPKAQLARVADGIDMILNTVKDEGKNGAFQISSITGHLKERLTVKDYAGVEAIMIYENLTTDPHEMEELRKSALFWQFGDPESGKKSCYVSFDPVNGDIRERETIGTLLKQQNLIKFMHYGNILDDKISKVQTAKAYNGILNSASVLFDNGYDVRMKELF